MASLRPFRLCVKFLVSTRPNTASGRGSPAWSMTFTRPRTRDTGASSADAALATSAPSVVGHAAENMTTLRRLALNLVKSEKSLKIGVEAKRKRAGWDLEHPRTTIRLAQQDAIALRPNPKPMMTPQAAISPCALIPNPLYPKPIGRTLEFGRAPDGAFQFRGRRSFSGAGRLFR